jgi:hypothetical protein
MTYSVYDTPSGGAPTVNNPGAGMEGWSAQQWAAYNQQIASEWGIAPDATGILAPNSPSIPPWTHTASSLPPGAHV